MLETWKSSFQTAWIQERAHAGLSVCVNVTSSHMFVLRYQSHASGNPLTECLQHYGAFRRDQH